MSTGSSATDGREPGGEPAAPRRGTTGGAGPRTRAGADRFWFLVVGAATLVFLALAGYPRQWSQGLLINDEYWYAHLARSLYEGAGYVTNAMHPIQAPQFDGFPVPEGMKQSGYPLVASLVWLLTGVSTRALIGVAAVGLALFAGAVFLLARRLEWSLGVSLFVAAATVVNPTIANYGVQALPESLYLACFTFVVLLLLHGGRYRVAGAGALNAVLIVLKGHGIIYVPVFLAYLWARGSGSVGEALRPDARKGRAALAFFGALMLTLVLASIVLPEGAVQIFEAGGTYSYGFLIETGRATSTLPYREVQPVDAWTYIRENPAEYVDKVARQVRRTKTMVDALAPPAFSGILFPALLLSLSLLGAGSVSKRELLPTAPRGETEPYLLFGGVILMTFAFFWPIFMITRFLTQALPLMLLLCMYVGWRLGGPTLAAPVRLRRPLAAAMVAYFVVYPGAVTVWDSYRQPMKHIGSMLAVRYLDYEEMAANVNQLLPEDPIVITDMAHEITWYTGARTILFPTLPRDLEYLVDRYDVDAIYEHPALRRDWPAIRARFRLVDDDDGVLWVRRRDER